MIILDCLVAKKTSLHFDDELRWLLGVTGRWLQQCTHVRCI